MATTAGCMRRMAWGLLATVICLVCGLTWQSGWVKRLNLKDAGGTRPVFNAQVTPVHARVLQAVAKSFTESEQGRRAAHPVNHNPKLIDVTVRVKAMHALATADITAALYPAVSLACEMKVQQLALSTASSRPTFLVTAHPEQEEVKDVDICFDANCTSSLSACFGRFAVEKAWYEGTARKPDSETGALVPMGRVTNFLGCLELCVRHSWCRGWDFHLVRLECQLFETLRHAYRRTSPTDLRVTGTRLALFPESCVARLASPKKAQKGGGVSPLRVYSAASNRSCCLLCSQESAPQIEFFWVAATGDCRCWPAVFYELISPAGSSYLVEHGVWYMGHWGPPDKYISPGHNVNDCCRACDNHSWCMAWNWVHWTGECHLQHWRDADLAVARRPDPGHDAGLRVAASVREECRLPHILSLTTQYPNVSQLTGSARSCCLVCQRMDPSAVLGYNFQQQYVDNALEGGGHLPCHCLYQPDLLTQKLVTVCTQVHNDVPYLLEWIEFHRLMFGERSHFVLYDDRSIDHVERLEQFYRQRGLDYVEVHPTPSRFQERSSTACIQQYRNTTKWVVLFDSDEYMFPVSSSFKPFYSILEKQGPTVSALYLEAVRFGTNAQKHRHAFRLKQEVTGRISIINPCGTQLITARHLWRGPHQLLNESKDLAHEALTRQTPGCGSIQGWDVCSHGSGKSFMLARRFKKIESMHFGNMNVDGGGTTYHVPITEARMNHYYIRSREDVYVKANMWGHDDPIRMYEQTDKAFWSTVYDPAILPHVPALRLRLRELLKDENVAPIAAYTVFDPTATVLPKVKSTLTAVAIGPTSNTTHTHTAVPHDNCE